MKAELATTTDGEEVLLQHEFIVGNVTSCLMSLGQLYQGGWTIHKNVFFPSNAFMASARSFNTLYGIAKAVISN